MNTHINGGAGEKKDISEKLGLTQMMMEVLLVDQMDTSGRQMTEGTIQKKKFIKASDI